MTGRSLSGSTLRVAASLRSSRLGSGALRAALRTRRHEAEMRSLAICWADRRRCAGGARTAGCVFRHRPWSGRTNTPRVGDAFRSPFVRQYTRESVGFGGLPWTGFDPPAHRPETAWLRKSGGGGIRTHETAQHRLAVFKTAPFDRSGTPPRRECTAAVSARDERDGDDESNAPRGRRRRARRRAAEPRCSSSPSRACRPRSPAGRVRRPGAARAARRARSGGLRTRSASRRQ